MNRSIISSRLTEKYSEAFLREGPEQFDFAKAEREQPKNCGTYKVEGDKITFTWGGGRAAETLDFAREKDGNIKLGGLFTSHVGKFNKGQRLDGSYSHLGNVSASNSLGASFVGNAHSIRFKPDGSFESSSIGAVNFSTPGTTGSGSSQSSSTGTYTLDGNTMTLQHADGHTSKHTVYPWGEEKDPKQTPERVNIDGAIFHVEKK